MKRSLIQQKQALATRLTQLNGQTVKREDVRHLEHPLSCIDTGATRALQRRYHRARFSIRSRGLEGKLAGVKKL